MCVNPLKYLIPKPPAPAAPPPQPAAPAPTPKAPDPAPPAPPPPGKSAGQYTPGGVAVASEGDAAAISAITAKKKGRKSLRITPNSLAVGGVAGTPSGLNIPQG